MGRKMRKSLVVVIIAIVAAYSWNQYAPSAVSSVKATLSNKSAAPNFANASNSDRSLTRAYEQKLSNIQVEGRGKVEKILADDTAGSRHQKFILRLNSGQTLLVAHNIDLAPRIASLQTGDDIAFFGEYEWNQRGGVIHWTHHDPAGRHRNGWLEHRGRRYQ